MYMHDGASASADIDCDWVLLLKQAIHNLASNVIVAEGATSSALSYFFKELVTRLLIAADRCVIIIVVAPVRRSIE